MNNSRGISLLMAAILFAAVPLQGQLVELSSQSEAALTGRLPKVGIEFLSALESPERGRVEIRFAADLEIRAELDYAASQVSVKSLLPGTDVPAALSESAVQALAALREAITSLPPDSHRERLQRTLDFLFFYPPGMTVDVTSPRIDQAELKSISSLCTSTGKRKSGTYDVDGKTYRETVQVGPCYSQPNECMGRCGPGCGVPPNRTIQIFAQDCLNHDLCTRKTGTIFGECSDEWASASDDFLIGKDCGDLRGKWTDSYSFSWDLTQQVTGLVNGKVNSPRCSTSTVSGLHSESDISLTARLNKPNAQCCNSFTYTGKAKSCNLASGTWRNACGLQGTWSMTRKGKTSSLVILDEEGEDASPEDVNPQ